MVGEVGLTPDEYYSNTLFHNSLLALRHSNAVERQYFLTRNIEFAIYSSTFSMNGKQMFKTINKPKDLYELPSDKIKIVSKEKAVFDLERAEAAYNKSNNKPKWL